LPSSVPRVGREGRRADAAEQELQAFSYLVSHDLSASFRQVAGFSRLLLGELGEHVTPRQQAYAAHIEAATEKCQSMMEQLLALSRVQQNPLDPRTIDATAIARRAKQALAAEITAAGADVSIETLGHVRADPALLDRAVHALLDNAIKFHAPGVAPLVVVQAINGGGFWRLRVSDNGPGVAPESRQRAFGMFQRLNTNGQQPGVGAGLALCRRIARRHGGDARFVDTDGGACVELALPNPLAAP
jgi:signal transduction histidine kinase